ncbi:hypothetical protein [Candidatus Enterovibrio altilux]|uniref:hypothetical protein n=1 Tax=Candidatus Enterovibrio altilux TaxID=1927128 RepID=UPI003742CC57
MTAELSASNITDSTVLPNVFKQTRCRLNETSGDKAYDTRQCYETIRIKRAVPIIPQRKGATF